MIDFNELINNFLKRELREKQIGRYYPSECGSCIRKSWYSYKKPKETDIELIKVFEAGNMIHDFVVEVLKSEKNPHVELVDSEVPFKINIDGLVVSGRIDNVITVNLDNKKYLVEVKSTSNIKYTNEPKEGHELQLQLYMKHMNVHNGIILYIEKNTLQSKTFKVDYDPNKSEKATKRFKILHECLINNVLPEPEARLDENKKWECRNCSWFEECKQDLK